MRPVSDFANESVERDISMDDAKCPSKITAYEGTIMQRAYLKPSNLKMAQEILDWTTEVLDVEHPELPNSGKSTCPFVAPSKKEDCFYLAFHEGCSQYHEIEQVLLEYIKEFPRISPYKHINKCLLAVFPDVKKVDYPIIKRIQVDVRLRFAESNMMLGPFYPRSRSKSAYGGRAKLFDAPYPFFAIRQMAIHDILFMSDDPASFDIYNRRYGARFRSKKLSGDEAKYRERYFKILDRFASR